MQRRPASPNKLRGIRPGEPGRIPKRAIESFPAIDPFIQVFARLAGTLRAPPSGRQACIGLSRQLPSSRRRVSILTHSESLSNNADQASTSPQAGNYCRGRSIRAPRRRRRAGEALTLELRDNAARIRLGWPLQAIQPHWMRLPNPPALALPSEPAATRAARRKGNPRTCRDRRILDGEMR